MLNRNAFLKSRIEEIQESPDSKKIPINLAGVRISFETSSLSLEARLRTYYSDYLEDFSAADVIVRLEPFSSENIDEHLWENQDSEFEIHGDWVFHRDFAAVRKFSDKFYIDALLAPDLDDAFHNLIRWFLPLPLLTQGGFLLHGAGVIKHSKGYVFFGQSGAGKSTTTRLICDNDPAVTPLGDDAVIIKIEKDTPTLFSAPVGCGYTRKAPPRLSAPIAGLYSLKQDQSVYLEELTFSQGLHTLLASTMSVRHEEFLGEKFDLALQFVFSETGIKKLHFKKDDEFWRMMNHERKKTRSIQRIKEQPFEEKI